MDLSNASAIVTGGASGLGLATARRLAARGAHVVLIDLPGSDGAAMADEIGGKTSFAAARADQRLARAIAANGPLAVAATKRIIVDSADWPRAEEFARQREISEPVRASQDAREGALAFREKRPPRWQGR